MISKVSSEVGRKFGSQAQYRARKKAGVSECVVVKSKRLLLHYPLLNIGGAEKSSLRMMEALANRGWQITLVLTTGGGKLESEVDPRVEIVRLRTRGYGSRFLAAPTVLRKLTTLGDLVAYAWTRLIGLFRMVPFLFREYDAAAVLLQGTRSTFVRNMVHATTKIHWIRNDLERLDPDGRLTDQLSAADAGIDWYICVSESARQSLINRLPKVSSKTAVIYNVLDTRKMLESFGCDDPFPISASNGPRIVTVGRLVDRAKAIFRLARICRRLVDAGLTFRWFLIGSGPDEEKLRVLIAELGIQEFLLLLGPKGNPFPYYRHADLVAVLSYYEGLCGVINEAKVAGSAVVAADFAGVREQLTNGENGWIVANDEEAITTSLLQLLGDPKRIAQAKNDTYPKAILNDDLKIDLLEEIFKPKSTKQVRG